MNTRILMRYAVIGTLLRLGRPVGIGELIDELRASRPVDDIVGALTPTRMSDVLRAQVARGRVRRVRRGSYEVIRHAMSSSSRWRYQRWERFFDEHVRFIEGLPTRDADPPQRSGTDGPG